MNGAIETRVLVGGRPPLQPDDKRGPYVASLGASTIKVLDGWLADLRLSNPKAHRGNLIEAMVANLQQLQWGARSNKTAAPVSTPQAAVLSYPVGQQKLQAANRQQKRT